MTFRFEESCRREIAALCAAFSCLPVVEATPPLKHAAVAIVLVEAGDASGAAAFLLTRRTAGLRAHGGQWALPGGRCDPGETALQAALREVDEEIGLRLSADSLLGTLDDYPTRSGYRITPVVLWASAAAQLRPNPAEVESIHRIPLADIARADAVDFVTIPESDRRVVRVYINGDHVHAPTAAMIYQFREVLAGRVTRVHDLEQPLFAWK